MTSANSLAALSSIPEDNTSSFGCSSINPAATDVQLQGFSGNEWQGDTRVAHSQHRSTRMHPPSHHPSVTDHRTKREKARPGARAPARRLERTLTSLLKPTRRVGAPPSAAISIKAILFASWLNILLIFVPISWALHFTEQDDIIVFIFSFLAMIPLTKLLGFATDELVMRVGETIGGLLNATLGNMVEFVVAMVALTRCKLDVVKSSLMGTILSNILLVLGMVFFAGGTRFSEQGFLASAGNNNSSLLTLSVISTLILTIFNAIESSTASSPEQGKNILHMSHGVAFVLLFTYIASLVFQLWSHAHLYDDKAREASFQSTLYKSFDEERIPMTGLFSEEPAEQDETETKQPRLSVLGSIVLLIVITVFVAVTAVGLVDSIDGVTEKGKVNRKWVAFILIPLVGGITHVPEVFVAMEDKVTLCLTVAVGSSIQLALFIIPIITIVAWITDKPLSLLFDPYESVMIFLAAMTVNYCVQDNKSNWLEGMLLLCLYFLISYTSWWYTDANLADHFSTCNA